MALNFDLETLVENALSGILSQEGLNVERWEDLENLNLTPVTKIQATEVEPEPGTMNSFIASRVFVDIICYTAKKRDTKGLTANVNRAIVRSVLDDNYVPSAVYTSGTIATRLNAVDPHLLVYERGCYPVETFDDSDAKLWGKGLGITVIAQTSGM